MMDAFTSIGIRATVEPGRFKLVVKTGEYDYLSLVVISNSKMHKVWKHVEGSAVRPSPVRVLKALVRDVAATSGADAIEAVSAITQSIIDEDQKKIDEFDATEARAENIILRTLSQTDALAIFEFATSKEKILGHKNSEPRIFDNYRSTIHLSNQSIVYPFRIRSI